MNDNELSNFTSEDANMEIIRAIWTEIQELHKSITPLLEAHARREATRPDTNKRRQQHSPK